MNDERRNHIAAANFSTPSYGILETENGSVIGPAAFDMDGIGNSRTNNEHVQNTAGVSTGTGNKTEE